MPSVVVIGGGVAGLACAHALIRRGVDVTVLEESDRLGGNVLTLSLGGTRVDAGPDALLSTAATEQVLAELGLSTEMVAPRTRTVMVARAGSLFPLPDGLLLGVPTSYAQIARTPLVSWSGKLRAALDPVMPASPPARSFGELVERRLGREVKDWMVEPLAGSVLAGDIDTMAIPDVIAPRIAGKRSLLFSLATGKRGAPPRLIAPLLGMSRLVERLAERVREGRIRLCTPAVRLDRGGARRFVVVLPDGSALPTDDVVLATPPHRTAELLAAYDPELASSAARVTALSSASVLFVFPPGTELPDGSGMLVPRAEGKRLVAATFVSRKWARPGSTGAVIVRAFLGGARDPSVLERCTDDELEIAALDDLRRYLPLPPPLTARVVRFSRGMLPPDQAGATLRKTIAERAAAVPGLHLAGPLSGATGLAASLTGAAAIAARVRGESRPADFDHGARSHDAPSPT
jgi:protoporphyrinogen/coproporphyrinogen III oxidase